MAATVTRPAAARAGLALLAMLLVVGSCALASISSGMVRLDLVVLATLVREVRSVPQRVGYVLLALASSLILDGVSGTSPTQALLAVVQACAVAAVLSIAPRRAGADATPGHRFAVVSTYLVLVAVLAGVAEAWLLPAATVWTTFPEMFFARTLPLAVASFVAGAVAARPTLLQRSRSPLSTLAGPFIVVALVGLAARAVLAFWAADDSATLQTAADTASASFQQAVGTDIDSYMARAATAPRLPWDTQASFAQSMQPFLGGNASVSALALLAGTNDGPRAVHVLSRQGSSPDLAATMGGGPADKAAVDQVVDSGSLRLLGVREVPAADAAPESSLVFVTPQSISPQPESPRLLSMAVSLPVLMNEAALGLGPLNREVALVLVDASAPGSGATLTTVVPEDAIFDADVERASADATFGTVTLRIEALATDTLGPSLVVRTLVLGGLAGFGIVALFLVLQAANARYRSQRRLEDREELLATAIASAPGLVALVDVDGVVRMANGGTEKSSDELVGRHVVDVMPFTVSELDRPKLDALLAACITGTPGTLEHVDMTSEESLRIYLVNANPVQVAERGGVRGLIQVQDVTEQRARAVRGAQAQRLQALGTMAGGLAHDFNNLLFIITGYLQMLQEDDRVHVHAELVRYVDRAVDAAGRGTEIASSLLAVSRSQPLQASDVEVGEFVGDLMPLVRQAVGGQRSVTLTVDPGNHDVLVDSGQLSSAVLNLVINARDATTNGGVIDVHVGRRTVSEGVADVSPGEYVVFEVRDNGTGMSPDVVARAFEPFFSTKSMGNGTGLGLTAVYSLATQSGGMATITTEPGSGTSVHLFLPLARRDGSLDEPTDDVPIGGARRVLVVDDESSLAGLVAAWVEETGAVVRVATSPADALGLADSFRPDVLVTDIRLGDADLDGVEVAARVTMLLPDVAVILMTGYSDRMTEAQQVGGRVLAKPFTKVELHEALRVSSDVVASSVEVTR